MAIPFMAITAQAGHEVHLTTDASNVDWCRALLPFVEVKALDVNPFADRRAVVAGYDAFVNFNNVEQVDYWTDTLGIVAPVQQVIYGALAQARGLPLPARLSPSDFVNPGTLAVERRNTVLVFSRAADNPSRTLAPNIVEQIRAVYPDALVDPPFKDKLELFRAVASARLVIGSDSGPYHVAETVGTPWRCLFTTMNAAVRCQFYRHGAALQSNAACSPCFKHLPCDNLICVGEFGDLGRWLRENDPRLTGQGVTE